MTKIDYIRIVGALRLARSIILRQQPTIDLWPFVVVVGEITDMLESDNPNFNRDKFIEAINGID